jgi:hypothetical protein
MCSSGHYTHQSWGLHVIKVWPAYIRVDGSRLAVWLWTGFWIRSDKEQICLHQNSWLVIDGLVLSGVATSGSGCESPYSRTQHASHLNWVLFLFLFLIIITALKYIAPFPFPVEKKLVHEWTHNLTKDPMQVVNNK